MPRPIVIFVRVVDAINYRVGRFAMYLLFVLMGILLWSSLSKVTQTPSMWPLEAAQFVMMAYFLLGGPYSMQTGDHVRMDLLYGNWSERKRSWFDAVTVIAVIFFLCVLLYGGIESMMYSIQYNERSPSPWKPYMWPIKAVMNLGILLMILQSLSIFFKDVAFLRGKAI
jgi:TRAP-type mannitol/chloroaromatic compound transport system permease small subunit